MRRFWIDKTCLKDQEFIIKGSLYHHISRLCQIKKGEPFELFCEGLQRYKVSLKSFSSSKAIAGILKTHPVPPLKKPYLNLALSIPHFSKTEFLIEKAVELGVKEFHPFISDFSFIKKSSSLQAKKEKHWKQIVEQNLAQSARTEPLILYPLSHLKDIRIPEEDLAFMAYEGETKTTLPKLIQKKAQAKSLWLFIGSEGGFSAKEAEDFSLRKNSFVCSFGDQILRVETACLFGLSILKYHYHFFRG